MIPDPDWHGMLATLGIVQGKPFNPDERQKKILTEAARVGEIMARTIAYEKRFANAVVWPGKPWEYANLVELDQEAKNYTQLDERGSWFYEAIGNPRPGNHGSGRGRYVIAHGPREERGRVGGSLFRSDETGRSQELGQDQSR